MRHSRAVSIALVGLFAVGSVAWAETDWPSAPVPKTGKATSLLPGDDGDLQKGIKIPSPRFADNGDGTVVDNLTGLTWLKDASCDNPTLFWTDAVDWGAALYDGCVDCGATGGDCGLADGSVPGDWRLPNVLELHSLIHHGFISPALPNTHGGYQWSEGDPFVGVEGSFYWSSTVAVIGADVYPWKVLMAYGDVLMSTVVDAYCWPVKGSLMFADGFGSADTRRWSSVAP